MTTNYFSEYHHKNYCVFRLVCQSSWKQNTYVIQEQQSKDIFIIDPGVSISEIQEVLKKLNGKLKGIYLTHGHHDHIAAIDKLYEQYDIKALIKKEDEKLVKRAPMYAYRFEGVSLSPVNNYETFICEDELEINSGFKALSTPGHTEGSVCFVFPDFVFTGDLIFFKKIGRIDLPGGDKNKIISSINLLLAELNKDQIIYPGHGKPWIVSEAKAWWNDEKAEKTQHNSFDDEILKMES
jgi:glyoxylase-like metal-dependent hydrolase (beta-lactamase superfamily II)